MMRHAGWRVLLTVLVLALPVQAEDPLNGEAVAAGAHEALTTTITSQLVAQAQSGNGPPPEVIVEAQTLLTGLGYEPGPVNGVWNERTKQAYRKFLRDKDLPAGETLTPAVLETLRALAKFGGGGPGGGAARPSVKATRSDVLHRAAKAGNLEGLKAALAAGADVNARDGRGWTALMYAVNKGYLLLVDPLLVAKADPDVRAPDGATALFMAVVHGQPEIVTLLMEAGADGSIKGPKGKTAEDMAGMIKDSAIRRALEIPEVGVWMGVAIQELTPALAQSFQLPESHSSGVLVSEVHEQGPSAKGGIQRGDVLLEYRGKKLREIGHLRYIVARTLVGEEVEILVLRDGEQKTLTVKVGERPTDEMLAGRQPPSLPSASEKFDNVLAGLDVDTLTDERRQQLNLPEDVAGVVVNEVKPGSEAEAAGIQQGDVIQEVSRKVIKSLSDYQNIASKIEKSEMVVLLLSRRGNNLFVAVNPNK